jgi:hypothetical protein
MPLPRRGEAASIVKLAKRSRLKAGVGNVSPELADNV